MLRRILSFLGMPGALAAAASLALAGFNLARLEVERAHEAEALGFLVAELAQLRSQGAELEQYRANIRDFLARKQIIEVLGAERQHGLRLVNEVVERRTEGIALARLAVQGKRMELRGFAPSGDAAQAFVTRLASSPHISAAEGLTTRPLRSGIEFGFRAELRPAPGAGR